MTDDPSGEAALRLALSQRPDDAARRGALAAVLAAEGRREEAVILLREGLLFCATREDRLLQLAEAMQAIDALPDALEALQAASRLAPGDTGIRERLDTLAARLRDGKTATRQLFNQYAVGFEDHLAQLHYVAPAEIKRLLEPYAARLHAATIVDLGCGTGLMGARLQGLGARLVGIDLSPAMLEQARSKNIYDRLIEGDMVAALATLPDRAALVVAADVLVYVGDLAPLFEAVARVLTAGGLFAFTVERHSGEGYAATPANRFAHSESYIRAVAENAMLNIISCKAITPRYDRGLPVEGLLVLLVR